MMKMRKVLGLTVVTTFMLSVMVSVSVPTTKAAAAPIVLGYYTVDSGNDLTTYGSNLTHVSTDTFNTDVNGNLIGTVPTAAVSYANSHGQVPYALVSNYNDVVHDWDSSLAHAVLTNSTARSNLITNMLNLVKNNNYKGINIDFEGMLATEGPNFTSFVHDVAAVMHANNLLTMVSVPAKNVDDPNDSWTYPFNFTALGTDADLLQIMTYDEYGVWSGPGPVTSKSFITNALNYAVAHVSPQKLLMGIPAYGNDWNLSDATGSSNQLIYWKNMPQLIADNHATPVRDAASGSMKFTYTLNGKNHEVWYEDSTSIAQKTNYTISYGLAGVSVYCLGEEDANFWSAINTGLQTPATGQAIPGKIEAENFKAMSSTSTEPTSDAGGGLDVGWNGQSGWLDYAINAQTAGTYNVDFRVASPVSGGVFQIKDGAGTLLGSLNIPNTGGYQTWQTATTAITLPAGAQTIRISLLTGDPNLNWLNFTKQASGATGVALPAKIQAENYDAMSATSTETTTDTGGGLNVGWNGLGGWVEYKVNVQNPGTYSLQLRVASPVSGGKFLITSNGTTIGTFTIPNTGGYQTWQTASMNVTLPSGNQTIRIKLTTGDPNLNWLNFVKTP